MNISSKTEGYMHKLPILDILGPLIRPFLLWMWFPPWFKRGKMAPKAAQKVAEQLPESIELPTARSHHGCGAVNGGREVVVAGGWYKGFQVSLTYAIQLFNMNNWTKLLNNQSFSHYKYSPGYVLSCYVLSSYDMNNMILKLFLIEQQAIWTNDNWAYAIWRGSTDLQT